ncbi:YdcF family protein [Patescibacteria group bacterium]|nr:YdcF family protein [Patescibacteria group bacterium]MBU4512383.1 YdcF family protein [Patescibacteria group bacterium]MCG2692492.1 YdcF family protein [Candidatus Parcubacteria bacterium]
MTIVVLGGGINIKNQLPQQVKKRLNKATEIFKKHKKANILVCGKHSFLYPKDKAPLKIEAEAMRDYLLTLGLPPKRIYLEIKSQDTIGNAYYAKKLYFIPRKEKSALVITSQFHLERTKFIFKKIFGTRYQLKFVSIRPSTKNKDAEKVAERQKELLAKTKELLSGMKSGNHNFLKGKLYKLKYYQDKRPGWVIKFATQGK